MTRSAIRGRAAAAVAVLLAVFASWFVPFMAGTAAAHTNSGASVELTGPPDAQGYHAHCNVYNWREGSNAWKQRASCQFGPTAYQVTAVRVSYSLGVDKPVSDNSGWGTTANLTHDGTNVIHTNVSAGRFRLSWNSTSAQTVFSFRIWGLTINGTERTGATIHNVRVAGVEADGYPQWPEDYYSGGTGLVSMIYDQDEPLGTCRTEIEPLDGAYYVTVSLTITNRPPAGPYLPGVGPFAEDFVSLDLPWTAPTTDDDQYSFRSKLPDVSNQPAGGWEPRFHLRRRLVEYHGFKRPGVHEADYITASYPGERYDGSEEVTLTCPLTVDLSDPNKGSTGGLGGFEPDVEQTPLNFMTEVRKCIPPGLQALNPFTFTESMGCILKVAFIPTIANPFDQIEAEANATVVADVSTSLASLDATYGVLKAGANAPSGCEGSTIDYPLNGPAGYRFNWQPFNLCHGGASSLVSTMRLLGLVSLYIAFAYALARLLTGAVGLAWGPMDRSESAAMEDGFKDPTPGDGLANLKARGWF